MLALEMQKIWNCVVLVDYKLYFKYHAIKKTAHITLCMFLEILLDLWKTVH